VARAIREHARDFVAIIALVVVALAVLLVILIQQRADFPEWVPGLGEDRFELRAELTSAQAVTPGQGQSVNIAGIRVGAISSVELEQGEAVVSMEVDNEYAPLIREDATFLLRPRTGLQDMVLEVDTGSPDSAPIEEGSTVPTSQTSPNVNPDEVLASLDADTRGFLRLLLSDGARALDGRAEKLSAVLRRFEPTARDIAKFQGALASRRHSLERVIHNYGALVQELGRRDGQLKTFVDSSNAVLSSFASQEGAIRESLRELPPTLEATRSSLESSSSLARVLGPAATRLTPAAQALAPALRQVRPLFRDTVEPIREQIRPFTRQVQEPVRHLNQAARGLAESTPALSSSFSDLNILFNELAYNPPGAEDEGFLFWLSWLNHNANSLFTFADGNGPLLRGLVLLNCGTANLAESVARIRPYLLTLQEATNVPRQSQICPGGSLFRRAPAEIRGEEPRPEPPKPGTEPSDPAPQEPADPATTTETTTSTTSEETTDATQSSESAPTPPPEEPEE
jgi:phospholipid/cholesterol/gamma-HCH transport system substrate-binding protein